MILKNRNLLTLFITQLLSRFGDSIETIAFLFLIMKKTESALSLSGFVIINTLPNLLFSPIAGVLADRFPRKWIMVISEAARGLVICGITILYFANKLEVYHLYIAGFVVSVFESFFTTSKSSSIPNLVPENQLNQAISFMQVSYSLAQVISLGISGVIIAALGYGVAFGIDAASFLISAIAIVTMTIPQKYKETASTFFKDFIDGFKYVKSFKILIYVMIAGFFVNFFIGPINVLIPIITQNILGAGETKAGVLFALLSVGMVVGSVLASMVYKMEEKLKTNITFFVLFCGLGISLLALSKSINLMTYSISFFLLGLCVSLLCVVTSYIFQRTVSDEYRGRASSLLAIIMLITMPLSVGLAGIALETISVSSVLLIGAIAILTFSIVTIFICPKKA